MEMNSPRFRAELDNYITNGRYYEFTTDEECWNCGYKWEAQCFHEYGRTYFKDDDGMCPHCEVLVEDS